MKKEEVSKKEAPEELESPESESDEDKEATGSNLINIIAKEVLKLMTGSKEKK